MSTAAAKRPNSHNKRRLNRWLFAFLIATLAGLAGAGPWSETISRISLDILLPVKKYFFANPHRAQDSKVVVIALDEETYRQKPFISTPKVAWTKHLGEVITAVFQANPKVMGFDLIYSTTLDQRGLLRGYDKPLLRALLKSGRAGRLVMGSVQFGGEIMGPYRMQILALGGAKNVRLVNLLVDNDDVIRRYPARHALPDGGDITSFGGELVKRAGGKVPKDDFIINFNAGSPAIPTYSFADIWQCAHAGRTDFFAKNFAGKVVLFGVTLSVEDRKVPASRFALDASVIGPAKAAAPRCISPAKPVGERTSTTIPGVYIHAAAINTLLHHGRISIMNGWLTFAAITLAVVGLVMLFFRTAPLFGALGTLLALALLLILGTLALNGNYLLPIIPMGLATLAAFPATYGYRFVAEDKEKRIIKNAFQHYLAPELIEELAENPESLKLGGVAKTLSIYFSDIAGFTTISEGMAKEPERLVELMNQYLTRCTEIIEAHGGYVDKYIGDAVMAIWGPPLDCPDGARRSVETGLDIRWELTVFSADVVQGVFGLSPIGTRMGINTGIAVVGNMGSEKRFNYTVTGDTVNLAARLEGANKVYGTDFMIGETTLRAMRRDFKNAGIGPQDDDYIVVRRLDRLVVKGKTLPVKVYDVIGKHGDISDDGMAMIRQFHHGLALYYKRRFAEAKTAFAGLTPDSAAAVYVERCEHFMAEPPEINWDGSFTMTTK